ncbi:TPA: hypothetical protein ACFOZR_000215 [Neisseria meningitidis]
MEKIYLDYQFIIDEVDDRKNWKLSNIDDNKYQIVYSPAHIEEIVRGKKCNKLKGNIFLYTNYVSNLTKDRQLIRTDASTAKILEKPFGENGIFLVEENPRYCCQRVLKYLDKNEIAEEGQKQILEDGNRKFEQFNQKNRQKKVVGIQKLSILDIFNRDDDVFNEFLTKIVYSYILKNIVSENLNKFNLDNNLYMELLCKSFFSNININNRIEKERNRFEKIFRDKDNIFKEISSEHHLVENIIDNLMKTLMSCGFYLEAERKATSNLHDTTHCLYAAYSDFFITRDKKLKYRVEAIYKYLGVKTQVIFVDSSDNEDILVDRFGKP